MLNNLFIEIIFMAQDVYRIVYHIYVYYKILNCVSTVYNSLLVVGIAARLMLAYIECNNNNEHLICDERPSVF